MVLMMKIVLTLTLTLVLLITAQAPTKIYGEMATELDLFDDCAGYNVSDIFECYGDD